MAHGDITHIDIPVGDMERAKGFYGGIFGWDIQEVPGFEGFDESTKRRLMSFPQLGIRRQRQMRDEIDD